MAHLGAPSFSAAGEWQPSLPEAPVRVLELISLTFSSCMICQLTSGRLGAGSRATRRKLLLVTRHVEVALEQVGVV